MSRRDPTTINSTMKEKWGKRCFMENHFTADTKTPFLARSYHKCFTGVYSRLSNGSALHYVDYKPSVTISIFNI